jgi:uncharacterized protein
MPLRWLLGTVGVLAASLLANRFAAPAHLAIGLVVVVALAAIARLAGLTRAELGLTRWRSGLGWGAVPAAALAAGYLLAAIAGPLDGATRQGWPAAVLAASLVIPLGTVLPEELAFRGVLWALLRRRYGDRTAAVVSSVLFGLWHVQPALGGGPANEMLGDGAAVRVVATVLFTGLAGLLLTRLRTASGSLLAPVLLHWAATASACSRWSWGDQTGRKSLSIAAWIRP